MVAHSFHVQTRVVGLRGSLIERAYTVAGARVEE